MDAFYLSGGLQFVSVFVLGFPFSIYLMIRDRPNHDPAWFLLSPALGATLYLSGGTILHSFRLPGLPVFLTLTVSSVTASVVILLRSQVRPPRRRSLMAIVICFIGAALALVLNSNDLTFAGLDYFPLTNNDTFSYLGHIDQIRATGWIDPRISYPAGYFPRIDHAVFTRTPSVIFAADFADILGLETHSAFFLTQRLALPVIALGASAIVMIATGSWVATLICFAPLIFGNILLHQILQQFSSSTMGTVIGTVVIATAIWTVRSERSEREVVVGHMLVGWACGTMAITSMEAHPFYLMAFGVVALPSIVRDMKSKRAVYCLAAFCCSYLVSSLIFIFQIWPVLVSQFVNAGSGHPGDWIAAPGFVIQAAGVAFSTAPSLGSYGFMSSITAVMVIVVFLGAITIIGWSLFSDRKPVSVLRTDRLALFSTVVLVTILQTILYLRGSGYGLLKLTDYFAFLGSVVVAVAGFQIGLTRAKFGRRAVLASISAYCLITFVSKQSLLGLYEARISQLPLPSTYQLDSKLTNATVSADLSAEPLNLFLYENRYSSTPIIFRAPETDRFAQLNEIDTGRPRYIARIGRVGIPGITLAEITYPADISPDTLTIVPSAGQIHLVLPDAHWLAPEGDTVRQLWCWMSVSGKFAIFGPLSDGMHLGVQLAAGPDLRPGNRIEVYVAGRLLQSVTPSDLPAHIDVQLPMRADREIEGEIRIVGPVAGIRQISVAQLRSFKR
jgi:hypothetical protein